MSQPFFATTGLFVDNKLDRKETWRRLEYWLAEGQIYNRNIPALGKVELLVKLLRQDEEKRK